MTWSIPKATWYDNFNSAYYWDKDPNGNGAYDDAINKIAAILCFINDDYLSFTV